MRVFFDIAEMQAKGTPPGELKSIIQGRYKSEYYKAPERAGISYMLSPILRTYTSPDENEHVATANIPHGYSVQFLGEIEREAIKKEYEELLTRLCEIKKEWCSPKSTGQPTGHRH